MVVTLLLLFLMNIEIDTALLLGNSKKWRNQLGSNVTLLMTVPDSEGFGRLSGVYETAVVSKQEENERPPSTPLFGTYRRLADGVLLSFIVQWRFKNAKSGELTHSTTSWTGKYFNETPLQFETTWQLLSDTSQAQLWSSVRTNKDVFTLVEDV